MKNKPPGRVKSVVLRWLGVEVTSLDQILPPGPSGRRINQAQALQLSAVWACVRLISESIATLPVGFYLKKADGSRKLATAHPLYSLLRAQPNANMTAMTFWEACAASLLLWGNSYVEIQRIAGEIVALNFLNPSGMIVRRQNGLMQYQYTDPSGKDPKERMIAPADMMHVPAFTTDGLCGLSPVRYGANVFGTAAATEDGAGEVFSRGMRAGGFVKSKELLKQTQRDQLRESIEKFRGGKDAGGIMVLEADMTFSPLTMNPVDAELLTSRGYGVEEICRWFRVPPFMVGHSEKSTSWGTGIEQQMIGFVTFVLRPWCVRLEQGVNRSLLSASEKGRYFAEFALEGLLRGDSASRAAFYGIMIDKGILTRDEVRALENWPAMGGNAEKLTVQSATVLLDGVSTADAASTAQDALKQWLSEV